MGLWLMLPKPDFCTLRHECWRIDLAGDPPQDYLQRIAITTVAGGPIGQEKYSASSSNRATGLKA
jgi:hypothetical protein